MEEVPKELNWVNERAKCEIKSAFESLRESIARDVEQYKSLPGFHGADLEFASDPNWLFSVTRRRHLRKSVVFKRGDDSIEITIQAQKVQTLQAIPEFTVSGCCKFHIDGDEGEPLFEWQLRRRVLESLLFMSQ